MYIGIVSSALALHAASSSTSTSTSSPTRPSHASSVSKFKTILRTIRFRWTAHFPIAIPAVCSLVPHSCRFLPPLSISPLLSRISPLLSRTSPFAPSLTMCLTGPDLFLALIAVLFPPIAVWIKTGICSCASLVNILLCVLGYLPGLFHAWYIIAAHPSYLEYHLVEIEDGRGGDRVGGGEGQDVRRFRVPGGGGRRGDGADGGVWVYVRGGGAKVSNVSKVPTPGSAAAPGPASGTATATAQNPSPTPGPHTDTPTGPSAGGEWPSISSAHAHAGDAAAPPPASSSGGGDGGSGSGGGRGSGDGDTHPPPPKYSDVVAGDFKVQHV